VGENLSLRYSMYMGLVVLGRQEIHTAQTLGPERSAFEVEMATEKLKINKSAGIHQISAELIRARENNVL